MTGRPRRVREGEGGFALLFSFWMFVILLMMVLAHGYWMYQEIPLTQAYVEDLRARALAWSALNIAAGALLADAASADTDLKVIVTEVMTFGENRPDIRINEVEVGTPGAVGLYNNSDDTFALDDWILEIDGSRYLLPAGTEIRARQEVRVNPGISITTTSRIYLYTDTSTSAAWGVTTRGDTVDSVVLQNVAGSPPAGKTFQVLPDGSNGEYWSGYVAPADPTSGTWKPGWVVMNASLGDTNGEGEWIMPGSVVWNRSTNESYAFNTLPPPGNPTYSDTPAYWVPADSYFILSSGMIDSPAFNDYFWLGRNTGGQAKGDSFPTTPLLDLGMSFSSVFRRQMHRVFDDSAYLSYPTKQYTGPADSYLFPITSQDSRIEIVLLRPPNFAWRYHTGRSPTVYPLNLGGGMGAYGYTYGQIHSKRSPHWRTFGFVGGDTAEVVDDYARATWSQGAFGVPSFGPDTYWNWLVPGDSSSLVVAGAFTDPYAATNDWKDTFQAFSPFDNHAGGWKYPITGAPADDDPDSSDWWRYPPAPANVSPRAGPPWRLDPYFNALYGGRDDWDTYAENSVGLAVSEVYRAPTPHLVISEVGADYSANGQNDYVEIYNPSGRAVGLNGWSVQAHATGTSAADTIVTFGPSDTIPALGYYLVADKDWSAAPAAEKKPSDLQWANNGWVALVSNNDTITGANDPDVVDLVGWGTSAVSEDDAVDTNFPTAAGTKALERKARRTSDAGTMNGTGRDAGAGNGYDWNNNDSDFIQPVAANPQDSVSAETGVYSYDFIEIYSSGYDVTAGGAVISPPWAGNARGGGIVERDHAYEYIELHNTSGSPIDMKDVAFVIKSDSADRTRYLKPWRTGDTTTIPSKGCALILPVNADTYVLSIPASGIVYLGLADAVADTVAEDTALGAGRPLRNTGEYFTIGDGVTPNKWHLNFQGKGGGRGIAWGKTDPFTPDPTSNQTLPDNWMLRAPTPGQCPSNADHLLEAWATLTRNTTTGENEYVQFGPDPQAYIRIWVSDESGKLPVNRVVADERTLSQALAAAATVAADNPRPGPDPSYNDITDTYVTPMDLFYMHDDNATPGQAITALKLKNWTVYGNAVLNVNTIAQYGPSTGAGDSTAGIGNPSDTPGVLREVIAHARNAHTYPTTTTHFADAAKVIGYRQGPDHIDGTDDDRVCDTEVLSDWLVAAGLTTTKATDLVNSGHVAKTSAGYFTIIGEGLILFPEAGVPLGHRMFWAVYERGWTGPKKGSFRYWRDNWHREVGVDWEGSHLPE